MQKRKVKTFFILGVLGFLLVSLFAFNVAAQAAVGTDKVSEFFTSVWDSWTAGGDNIPVSFAKIMFTLIVIILVYSVTDNFPGLSGEKKAWLRWVLAVVVGILATAYFTKGEVYALLLSYSGMGFALGTILPLFILFFFMYDTIKNENLGYVGKKVIPTVMWLAYGGFIAYRLYGLYSGVQNASTLVTYAHWIILAICIIAIAGMGFWIKKIEKGITKDLEENYARKSELAATKTDVDAAAVEKVGGGRTVADRLR